MLPLAILAGGFGRRLHPLTSRTPKSLVMVAGQPFLQHQLQLLRSEGIERVVLCVGHLGQQIRALVGDGRDWGLQVQYSFDGPEPLGTGGALLQALPLLGDSFFVLYGDAYLPCSFTQVQSAYLASGRPALLTVLRNQNRWDRSNVAWHGNGDIEYDKSARRTDMTHIDFGLAVLSRQALAAHAGTAPLDLAEVYRQLSRQRTLAAFEVTGRFYEIGSAQGLEDTRAYLAQRRALSAVHQ
jgi:MurNAc alpha-1-phosphate uridylyltransferase